MSNNKIVAAPDNRWRLAWRYGFSDLLPRTGLIALKEAIISDDRRLIQGSSTLPLRIFKRPKLPIVGACAVSFCLWQANEFSLVGEVWSSLDRLKREVKARIADAATNSDNPFGLRFVSDLSFLSWYNDTSRANMRVELLPEVELAIDRSEVGNEC